MLMICWSLGHKELILDRICKTNYLVFHRINKKKKQCTITIKSTISSSRSKS